MAEVLQQFEPRGNAVYPWDQWLDGQIWKLVRGVDYRVKTHSIRCAATSAARTRKKKIRIRIINDDAIIIQALLEQSCPSSESADRATD